jgi:hypothetical protein
LLEKSKILQDEVVAVFEDAESSAEDREIATKKLEEARQLVGAAKEMKELEAAAVELKAETKEQEVKNQQVLVPSGFNSLGHWLSEVYKTRPDQIHRVMASGGMHPDRWLRTSARLVAF